MLELIRAAGLPLGLADDLDLAVRGKYEELWRATQTRDEE